MKKKIARKPATKSKLPPVPLPKKNSRIGKAEALISGKAPTWGAGSKMNKSKKKINPLDKAIMEGRKLPSKNKKPGRYLDK